MPLYEYACPDCSSRFETLVRAWGDTVSCPKCSSTSVERLLSTFAMAGGGGKPEAAPAMGMPRGGGGCCGGGCGCH
jgi:putative FmdB family regulatory protein